MRTLTDVFAPGTPTLPEGLRTLVVSPERELEPGMTVRATFTFRNQGGAPATGVRVRFNIPEGLVYLVGSGKLDGNDLDEEQGSSPLLARAGAHIGDVAAGEERRIDIAYSVAGAIENGSTVELQAAVAAFELAPVGSNVVRLVAHSRPALENALTNVALESRLGAAGAAVPGGEATVTVRVHNAGESSAHDVVVVAPIPDHTSYIPNSARVNGREFERELLASFDRVHAPIIVQTLPAGATATLQYRLRIDDPLEDGVTLVARSEVASQEIAAFSVEPASLTVRARAEFENETTSLAIEPEYDVVPGTCIRVRAVAYNSGTTAAENVTLALEFPETVVPVRGSFRVDGQPLRERKKEDELSFALGTIGAREQIEFTCEGAVLAPIPDGSTLAVRASLRWKKEGARDLEATATVRSQPFFPPRRNGIARAGAGVIQPSDECEATITLTNDGSAAATGARLHVQLDPALDEVKIFEKAANGKTTKMQMDRDELDLGTIEAYSSRKITIRGRVRTPYANRSEIRIAASLHAREIAEASLGEAHWRVESHPAFSAETSALQLVSDEVFRPNQLAEVHVRVRNEGTDVANNVRLRLYVSPEARLESVEGATRERSALLLGEIRPGGVVEAKLGIRLLRSLAKAYPVTIESVLTAEAMLPVQLTRLTIVTTAEPNFSVGTLHSEPADIADAGDEIEYVLHVRNSGDGPARKVRISVDALDELIYVPNSTTVNDLPVRDIGAQSPLTSDQGIILSDVDPGIEATIVWREVVHNGLSSGETIVRTVRIEYDGDRVDEITAPELKVRCSPVFANAISGLPFGLDGLPGPSFGGGQRALPGADDRFMQLPAATPVALSLGAGGNGQLRELSDDDDRIVETILAFDSERLNRTLKFLGEARFGGLATHIFALRAFFPDEAGDGSGAALRDVRESLRETLDRLFIKLRLPHYVIAPRDLESQAARASVIALLGSVQPGRATITDGATVLRGACDAGELRALRDRLENAPLATALPWAALARFLPSESDAEANYRRMLVTSLDDLAGVDETAFVDALQRRPYPVLDAALDVMRAQLSVSA